MIVIGGTGNWHHEVSLSTSLIDNFVQGVEKQVADSIAMYRTSRDNGTLTVYDVGGDDPDGDSIETCRTMDVHQGLDSETWDLDELFERYFPNLQRRSALLTLWGFVEHELDKLCLLYQREKAFSLTFSDLSGTGIDRSTNYLEKVAELKGLKASQEYDQLDALREIRNAVTHNDGRLKGRDGKPKAKVLAAMKKVGYVTGDNELIFQHGFLSRALNICFNYFTVIGTATKKRAQT